LTLSDISAAILTFPNAYKEYMGNGKPLPMQRFLFLLILSGVFYIHTLFLLLQVQPALWQEVLSVKSVQAGGTGHPSIPKQSKSAQSVMPSQSLSIPSLQVASGVWSGTQTASSSQIFAPLFQEHAESALQEFLPV
jgi:hypothetical protein